MGFTNTFKNFGHAIAAGAKYFVEGVEDVLSFANTAQAILPEAEALVQAIAGPQAGALIDLAFHVLGDVASALKNVPGAVAASGLNVSLDETVVADIRAAVSLIEKLLQARGTPAPKV